MQHLDGRKYFFLAVNTGYVKDRSPDARCIDFYTARSGNGLFCAIVGNVIISGGAGSNLSCAWISEAAQWKALSASIASRGTLPGIQLATAWPGYSGEKRFVSKSPSVHLEAYRAVAKSITVNAVDKAFDDLVRSTGVALSAGFRHIQLHAAHGYFFSLCLHPALSEYAEHALTRAREWSDIVRHAGAESSIRLSTFAGHAELDRYWESAAGFLLRLPADYFDISEGFYNLDKRLIYPTAAKILAARIARALKLARHYPMQNFILSGKASAGRLEENYPNVHVGVCRDLIANPNFLVDQGRGCANCMKCHYFSRGKSNLQCGSWPA